LGKSPVLSGALERELRGTENSCQVKKLFYTRAKSIFVKSKICSYQEQNIFLSRAKYFFTRKSRLTTEQYHAFCELI
jgi:hypothetical protein